LQKLNEAAYAIKLLEHELIKEITRHQNAVEHYKNQLLQLKWTFLLSEHDIIQRKIARTEVGFSTFAYSERLTIFQGIRSWREVLRDVSTSE
jgi:hypothetical protein